MEFRNYKSLKIGTFIHNKKMLYERLELSTKWRITGKPFWNSVNGKFVFK